MIIMMGDWPYALTFMFVVLRVVVKIAAFNVETDHVTDHRGPVGSKFGFSIAQHKDSLGTWVLVGAPEDDETRNSGIRRRGSVYKCHPRNRGQCQTIPFDTKGNHHDGSRYTDEKSGQWFGASVVSRSGVVAACAPRYVWYSVKKNRREPIGNCFVMTEDRGPHSRFKAYSPCMTNSWGYHRQGTCQAGFGVALSQGGNRLYVGAVGSWYWQGQVFYQNLLNMDERAQTSEAPKEYDMSYMGFSLATGLLDGDSEEDLAVGVPRGAGLLGKIVLFNHELRVLYNITGDQLGSYFGYSLAVLDSDGDGLMDVAVGSPWYSSPHSPAQSFEEGAVAVFKHTQHHNYRRTSRLFGRRSRSHFGLALTSLNDLNGDGFEDLAVGAPRDGQLGAGAVYIFLGSPNGLKDTPAQVLLAEDVTRAPVRTFGWSLAGGLDMDDNEYPDLAVGAHESNRAFVFRTRPVVSIDATIRLKSENSVFDLESLTCSLQNNTDVPCYPLSYCASYTGRGVAPQLKLYYTLKLDTAAVENSPRLFFLKNEGVSVLNSTFELQKSVLKCGSLYVYAMPNVHDKLTPLVSEFSFDLGESRDVRFSPSDLRPVLAPPLFGQDHFVRDKMYFQNNCGDDNVCFPNLRTKVAMNEWNYVLGSSRDLVLSVNVSNDGEDSYATKAYVSAPTGVHFSKFLITYNGAQNDVTPFCTTHSTSPSYFEEEDEGEDAEDETSEFEVEQKQQANRTQSIVCELGNPLPAGSGVGLQLHFQPSSNLINYASIAFDVKVNSSNREKDETLQDNVDYIALPVVMESDVNIRGISWPDADFNYNSSLFGEALLGKGRPIRHESEVGPRVTHIYDVVNRGPSDLPNVEIYLLWPTRTLVGSPLLYLPRDPTVSPETITCEPLNDINYLGIILDPLVTENNKTTNWRLTRSERETAGEDERLYHESNLNLPGTGERLNLNDLLTCGSTNCSVLKCFTSVFKAFDNFVVEAESRLWVDTIEKLGLTNLKISSRLIVHSKRNISESEENGLTWSETVVSVIKTRPEPRTSSLKWLVWFGSAMAGLVVLAILIVALWRFGFFKRKRPQDEAENELIQSHGTNGRL